MNPLRRELRELLHLAWPIAIAQLGLPLMGLVDTAVIGRVDVVELAGASIARSVGFAAFVPALGVATGLEALAAQAIGAREPARAWRALLTTLRAILVMWLPLTAAALALTFALAPFGVEPAVVTRVRAYLIGQAPGMALYAAFSALKVYLQAHGSTRPALVAVTVANVINVVVCNLLVRGDDVLRDLHLSPHGLPRLGAFGAGLAASVSSVVLFAIVAPAAWAIRPYDQGTPVRLRVVFRLGVPIGMQMLAEVGVFTVAALLAGKLGKEIVSAHQVALGLATLTYMAALGVSGATAVVVGRAVGAGRSPRRAGLLGIAVGVAMMCVPAAVFIFVPEPLVRLFTHDAGVVVLGMSLLKIAGVFQLFDGMQAVAGGALRGAGDVRFSFGVNVAAYWVVGLPVALVLGFPLGWGASGIWWGLTLGLILAAIALAMRFLRVSSRPIARVH